MSDLYPAGPAGVSSELTLPTPAYKQRAWLAVASLAIFIALYLALAGWFVWSAYRLLNEAFLGGTSQFLNFLLGASAAFLAVFLLKALFFIKRGGVGSDVEVTEAEQPRLFNFLYRLADEAGAPRPNRVYLSARVNAAVFYDLSVVNLIFPSKKNLEIGLALVNVLTLSETKAVLAHEFGHFAQRSMAIGSWVYIAQQIATQVITKRDMLDSFLKGLSRTDPRIAWFGWVLSLIVWSIRSLLDTVLSVVVLAQRALSRQMEFQADLVSVSLTGSDELVHALHKLQAADEAWSRTLSFTNSELRQGRMPFDLFKVQTQIIKKMAHIFDDEDYGQVPKITEGQAEAHRVFKSGFAQPPQMWSTHPANADREENAKKIYLTAPHDARSAWLLFDHVEKVKTDVVNGLVGDVYTSGDDELLADAQDTQAKKDASSIDSAASSKAVLSTAAQTTQALDDFYDLPQFETRYRGAYLGRELTRYAGKAHQLYDGVFDHADVSQDLARLYAPELGAQLSKLRELEEEKGLLNALHRKVYQATGGRLVYRGREIARRELPDAIAEVEKQVNEVREQILAHDKQCRQAHLAAAQQLGGGWHGYLMGLINVLHYAEHSLADLRDAQGLLGNVVAVVTADGKVSSKELKKLIATANSLHATMTAIANSKSTIVLDDTILAQLKTESWSAMLEEFALPPASKDNINDWMKYIDGWVETMAGPLYELKNAALETLIRCEDSVARHVKAGTGTTPEAAPVASSIPSDYATLIVGQERKRQEKLGIWDRFMVADGMVASIARLLVAGSIVGVVLGFGNIAATNSTVTIYNGLGRDVQVFLNQQPYTVAPFSASEVEVELNEKSSIQSKTLQGEEIEHFTPQFSGHAQHYIYNVASASPLLEWPAVYGNATEQAARPLGALRWTTSNVDVYFAEPPTTVQTKGGGATRWVIDGIGAHLPEGYVVEGEAPSAEQKRIAQLHMKWDAPSAPNKEIWAKLAQ
jgi:Zn-dependent protease with chaperone function